MQEQLAYSELAAAKLADIGRTKLREEIKSGRLKARKVGKRVIITATDLKSWLDRLPPVTPSAAN